MCNLRGKSAEQKKIYGLAAIIAASFLASLDGILFRPALTGVPIVLVVFLEHLIGFVFLAPFIYIGWKRIKNLTAKDWTSLVIICVFGGLLGNFVLTKAYFLAVEENSALAAVIVLQKLQPFFVIVLANIFLKERMPKKFYPWAVVATIAAYFLSFGEEGISFRDLISMNIVNKAAFFAVIAALAYASSTVFGKRLLNHLDYKSTAALRYGGTFLFAIPLVCAGGYFHEIGNISFLHWQALSAIGLLSGGAIFFLIYYWGLRFVSASLTTIGELFWPLSGVALDYFINGNVLSGIQIMAVVVLLVAFYFVTKEGDLQLPTFSALTAAGSNTGRFIGFNTADLNNVNLDIDHGVYMVRAALGGKKYKGLLSFGFRETFGEGQYLELYLPDFVGNYYGIMIKIEMLKKIRDIKKFKSAEELREAIKNDLKDLENIK
ncbi:hypothetical protein COT99_00555 [Candidatus Falkowbacteria bacterium CG10_big_fil_rev_8_21_14_0_10_43_10]|uniref:riboflavin kinase n=1 Tax=Candidatus Falkowbacteria bacterium CG10_big_fil_rev_8_21_14_0_10_43_10 TaxID=1974567 RepID=A0A2H0V2Z2_9BACT|nr:MAG: hypothetical protein COT99_00555 [Candidatus Falkowbacteria bacterium CG10_big_fil_rev_8_21_14_0_10_43_10]